MKPELWQILVMLAAGLCFAGAFGLGWRKLRAAPAGSQADSAQGAEPSPAHLGAGVRVVFALGLLLLIALGVSRGAAFTQQHTGATTTAPGTIVFFYYDYFLLLGLLLGLLVAYFRFSPHLRWLGFFLLPLCSLVLLMGLALSLLSQQTFDGNSWLNRLHLFSVLTGSLCFAAASTAGVVYLLADWQLRHRGRQWRLPALGRIEKFMQHAIYLGFPLLTVAMISGAWRAVQMAQTQGLKTFWVTSPKIHLAVAAWVVYGVLLHVPLAPAFRGKRAAWLSIGGFGLLLSVFFAVRWQGGM